MNSQCTPCIWYSQSLFLTSGNYSSWLCAQPPQTTTWCNEWRQISFLEKLPAPIRNRRIARVVIGEARLTAEAFVVGLTLQQPGTGLFGSMTRECQEYPESLRLGSYEKAPNPFKLCDHPFINHIGVASVHVGTGRWEKVL